MKESERFENIHEALLYLLTVFHKLSRRSVATGTSWKVLGQFPQNIGFRRR